MRRRGNSRSTSSRFAVVRDELLPLGERGRDSGRFKVGHLRVFLYAGRCPRSLEGRHLGLRAWAAWRGDSSSCNWQSKAGTR